ncbi:unnamed protein product [Paramecium pentaurelia]|uniref:Transmembrane protein n=1 Tax=Paramecium pentaurelia TaxID=43138 RepID=A0A8S1VZD4_9CILI|nr:unnamed protein product [Paramecium pentaurelia]
MIQEQLEFHLKILKSITQLLSFLIIIIVQVIQPLIIAHLNIFIMELLILIKSLKRIQIQNLQIFIYYIMNIIKLQNLFILKNTIMDIHPLKSINLIIFNNYSTSIQSDFNLKTQNLALIVMLHIQQTQISQEIMDKKILSYQMQSIKD